MNTVDVAGLPVGDGHPPRIMGVLNVSRESPYDPSVFDDPIEAARYVDTRLVGEGADIVDVGLESANKRFEVLTADEELDRLDVAVETIARVEGDTVFSIETRYAEVADEALSRGFDMVNDICGFADPAMPEVVEAHDVAAVKMASPPDLARPGAVDDVDWAAERSPEWDANASYVDRVYAALERGGLTDKTIVDPAFGGWSEAKTLDDDRETFRRLREFRALDRPILVSINRKNFLKAVVGRDTDGALPVSLGATALAVDRGVHVIRTHDVAATRDAALAGTAFARERVDAEYVQELAVETSGDLARHVERVGGSVPESVGLVHRAIAVSGLDKSDRDRLTAAGSDVGLGVFGDDALVIAGSLAGFGRLADRFAGANGSLGSVGVAVGELTSDGKTYTERG